MAEITAPNVRSVEEIVNDIAEKNLSAPASIGTVLIAAQGTDACIQRLDAKIGQLFGTLDSKMDRLFGTLDSKIDQVHSQLDSKMDRLFGTLDSKIDQVHSELDVKIGKLDSKIDRLDSKIDQAVIGINSTITKEISLLRVDVMTRKRTDKRELLQIALSTAAVVAALFALIAR